MPNRIRQLALATPLLAAVSLPAAAGGPNIDISLSFDLPLPRGVYIETAPRIYYSEPAPVVVYRHSHPRTVAQYYRQPSWRENHRWHPSSAPRWSPSRDRHYNAGNDRHHDRHESRRYSHY
jgi:hypothetical protein